MVGGYSCLPALTRGWKVTIVTMATEPRVSILVPAYNVEHYVQEALDSALAQEGVAVEVVVIDDGSTDGTARILDAYAASHPDTIVLVRQDNRGLAGARNTGLAHARGEFVGLLDADDSWSPHHALRCVELLDADPSVGVVTTDSYLLEEREPTDRRYYADHLGIEFPPAVRQLPTIAERNFVFVGAVVRRALLRKHGGFDEALRRAEDYDLWCRLLLAGVRFGYVDEPLGHYRLRSDSLSANRAAQWEAHLAVVAKHFDALVESDALPDATTSDALARRFSAVGDRRRAAAAFRAAARRTSRRSLDRRLRLDALALRALVTSPGRAAPDES